MHKARLLAILSCLLVLEVLALLGCTANYIQVRLVFEERPEGLPMVDVLVNGGHVGSKNALGPFRVPVSRSKSKLRFEMECYEILEREVRVAGCGLQDFVFKMRKKEGC